MLAALAVLLGVACASAGAESGTVRTLRATTSTGRQGAFYVPAAHEPRPLPLAVFLHGTGGKGSLMLARVRAHAERDGFIVVAPDSASVAGVWTTVPTSEDTRHVMASVREVMTLPDLRVDRSHVLIAGFSVGGAVAARLASQEDVFTAFAVLHGHVSTDALGARRVRGWLSTGDRDRVRTAAFTKDLAGQLTARARFPSIELRVFAGDHALSDDELAALTAWWLRAGPRVP